MKISPTFRRDVIEPLSCDAPVYFGGMITGLAAAQGAGAGLSAWFALISGMALAQVGFTRVERRVNAARKQVSVTVNHVQEPAK